MKKGLRPLFLKLFHFGLRPALRPDEEGIKTGSICPYARPSCPALRPDEEGIKTYS